jgi:hypothetical protein
MVKVKTDKGTYFIEPVSEIAIGKRELAVDANKRLPVIRIAGRTEARLPGLSGHGLFSEFFCVQKNSEGTSGSSGRRVGTRTRLNKYTINT